MKNKIKLTIIFALIFSLFSYNIISATNYLSENKNLKDKIFVLNKKIDAKIISVNSKSKKFKKLKNSTKKTLKKQIKKYEKKYNASMKEFLSYIQENNAKIEKYNKKLNNNKLKPEEVDKINSNINKLKTENENYKLDMTEDLELYNSYIIKYESQLYQLTNITLNKVNYLLNTILRKGAIFKANHKLKKETKDQDVLNFYLELEYKIKLENYETYQAVLQEISTLISSIKSLDKTN